MIKRLTLVCMLLALPISWVDKPDSTGIKASERVDSLALLVDSMVKAQRDINSHLLAIKVRLIQEKEITKDSLPLQTDSTKIDTTGIIHARPGSKGTRSTLGVRQNQGK